MTNRHPALSQQLVNSTPQAGPDEVIWDGRQTGLGLRRQSNRLSWVVRYRVADRQRQHSIPELIPLAEARTRAARLIANAREGRDVVQEGRQAAAAAQRAEAERQRAEQAQATRRLRYIVGLFLQHQEAHYRPSTFRDLTTYLRTHWQPLAEHVADQLDRRTIIAQLERIVGERGPAAARKAKAYLSMCLAWAVERGLLDRNPVADVPRFSEVRRRERVLSLEEARRVWAATDEAADYPRIIRLLLLTGARLTEMGGLCWSELDLVRGEWLLPAARSKNRRPLLLPLPSQALDILRATERTEQRDYVFGRGRGFTGWSRAKHDLDTRLSFREHWTTHDLRRTAVTQMAELGIAPNVIEAVVNHYSGHRAGVAGVYNRAEYRAEKAAALQRWADHLLQAGS